MNNELVKLEELMKRARALSNALCETGEVGYWENNHWCISEASSDNVDTAELNLSNLLDALEAQYPKINR